MKYILCIYLLIATSNSFAADIEFNWLRSTSGQNSALSGKCNNENSKMTCNLRQIIVRKKSNDEDVQKEVESITAEIDEHLKTNTIEEYEKAAIEEFCSALPQSKDKVDSTIFNAYATMCDNKTRNTVVEALTLSAMQSGRTCRIMEYDIGNFVFEQVNDKKWVSTNKPSGKCAIVTVLSLEQHPKYSRLWSYSQVRHYTNTDTEMCKSLSEVNESISYSWNGKKRLNMNCDFIEFGL